MDEDAAVVVMMLTMMVTVIMYLLVAMRILRTQYMVYMICDVGDVFVQYSALDVFSVFIALQTKYLLYKLLFTLWQLASLHIHFTVTSQRT